MMWMVVFEKYYVIRGDHNYQMIWTPELGEYLVWERESTNVNNRYNVLLLWKAALLLAISLEHSKISIHCSCSETALLIVLLWVQDVTQPIFHKVDLKCHVNFYLMINTRKLKAQTFIGKEDCSKQVVVTCYMHLWNL